MKITKRRLRRIIKEELSSLKEYGPRPGSTRGMSPEQMAAYDIGYKSGTQGDRSTMPEGAFYEEWSLGFDDGLRVFHGYGEEY